MKRPYEWILFDADETLFHFDAFTGLKKVFADFDITFTTQDYYQYQAVNQGLWTQYQQGKISAAELQCQRFSAWGERLNTPALDLDLAFQRAMIDICTPIAGARELLSSLSGKVKLGIITNGFTAMQAARLEATGLAEHFHALVISEEVGVAKPHPDIFDHAIELMGRPAASKVLMVGDNLHTDIIGGLNAGMHTCWFNRSCATKPRDITPHYEVESHKALQDLLV